MMLQQLRLMSGNEAAAYAVKQCDVDFISAYPITPQTTIVEKLSEYVAKGEMVASFLAVESEHSALSSCIGASAAGARVFTATSSQGLAYMHEVMYIASGLRLPIVMAVINRALSSPINIHCDHSDMMGSRDSGWVQLFCEDPQDVYDTIIKAYRLAEDSRVLLPVAVNFDGFTVSHCYEAVETVDSESVRRYLPRPNRPRLSYDEPITMGSFSLPNSYFEGKIEQNKAMHRAGKVFHEVEKAYPRKNSKKGKIIPEDKDAAVKIICMGGTAGSLRYVVNTFGKERLFEVISVRMFRPFPKREILNRIANAELAIVMDRALSFGASSPPLASDIKNILYEEGSRTPVWSVVYGLGGCELTIEKISKLLEKAAKSLAAGDVRMRKIYLK